MAARSNEDNDSFLAWNRHLNDYLSTMDPMMPPVLFYQRRDLLAGLARNRNHLTFDDVDDIPPPTYIESSKSTKSTVIPIPEDLN